MKAKERSALSNGFGCLILLMCEAWVIAGGLTEQAVGTQEIDTQGGVAQALSTQGVDTQAQEVQVEGEQIGIAQEKIKDPRIKLEEEIKEGSPPIQKLIKFIDGKGKIIKEIALGKKKIPKKFKDPAKNKVWNGHLSFFKTARVSKNQKYAVLNEYSIEVKFNIDNPKEAEEYVKTYGEEAYVGPEIKDIKLTLFDNNGNVLWKKEFPDRWIHYELLISNNGHIAVFTQKVTTASDYSESEWRDIIYVFDKKGKEILAFPTEEEYELGYIANDIPEAGISPNGRYLVIHIEKVDKSKEPSFPWKHLTRFYDLKKNTFWDSEKRYLIWNITNEGIAEVRDPETKKTIEINLKEVLEK